MVIGSSTQPSQPATAIFSCSSLQIAQLLASFGAQPQQTEDADTFAISLPADPFSLVPTQVNLSTGTVGGAVAETDKSVTT
jgi:hypothetical protein